MGRKLAKNVWVGETYYPAGSEPPKDAAEQITNPAAWGDNASDDGDDDEKPLSKLSKDELQAEVDRRNADRDDDAKIEVGGKGNKPDLVKALEADDTAQQG